MAVSRYYANTFTESHRRAHTSIQVHTWTHKNKQNSTRSFWLIRIPPTTHRDEHADKRTHTRKHSGTHTYRHTHNG